jgi:hypothetical protein
LAHSRDVTVKGGGPLLTALQSLALWDWAFTSRKRQLSVQQQRTKPIVLNGIASVQLPEKLELEVIPVSHVVSTAHPRAVRLEQPFASQV